MEGNGKINIDGTTTLILRTNHLPIDQYVTKFRQMMGIHHNQNISSQAKLTSARPAITGAMLARRRTGEAV